MVAKSIISGKVNDFLEIQGLNYNLKVLDKSMNAKTGPTRYDPERSNIEPVPGCLFYRMFKLLNSSS